MIFPKACREHDINQPECRCLSVSTSHTKQQNLFDRHLHLLCTQVPLTLSHSSANTSCQPTWKVSTATFPQLSPRRGTLSLLNSTRLGFKRWSHQLLQASIQKAFPKVASNLPTPIARRTFSRPVSSHSRPVSSHSRPVFNHSRPVSNHSMIQEIAFTPQPSGAFDGF